MTDNNKIFNHIKGDGYQFGAIRRSDGICFTTFVECAKSFELYIYNSNHDLIDRVNMLDYRINDRIASCNIIGDFPDNITYSYISDGEAVADLFSRNSTGRRRYKEQLRVLDENKIYDDSFDWENDKILQFPFNEVISYQLHVRGFTAHYSSKVRERGKFGGIIEKIPYLTELGINQVVLMPAYEFDEYDYKDSLHTTSFLDYTSKLSDDNSKPILNYWGFKEGLYYKPKSAYASRDAVSEFKNMVKKLHQAGIEVVMRFYFPDTFNRSLISDVLKFWKFEYHVDGFFLMGNNIPMDILSADPYLCDVKLYNVFFDKDSIISRAYGYNRNMAFVNNDFSLVCRKFLKSDENMLSDFLYRQRLNSPDVHVINYITDYEGFTLNDLVSYDYKHNEDNGEDNRDGENFNYSWNCGAEGFTRKQSVAKLRARQIRNAFVFLMFAQGTPMLLAGDELLNTQNGNNNPYCQDNEIGWMIWRNTNAAQSMLEFVKRLIRLRKEHPILHPCTEFKIMDYAACGFPDLSYHGDAAWAPKFDNHLRHIGVMYCGKYARRNRLREDDFFYIAYNMHWENHEFGLPKLPKGLQWGIETYTGVSSEEVNLIQSSEDNGDVVSVPGRTIAIIKSFKVLEETASNNNVLSSDKVKQITSNIDNI